jgi:hypothetical protein
MTSAADCTRSKQRFAPGKLAPERIASSACLLKRRTKTHKATD